MPKCGWEDSNFRLSGTSRQLRRSTNIQQMTLGGFFVHEPNEERLCSKICGVFLSTFFFNTNVIYFVKNFNPETGTLCCQTPSDSYPNAEINKSG